MFITIDNREQELITAIQSIVSVSGSDVGKEAAIQVKVEMLPLGDIIISDDDDNDLIIIERKKISDLLASIKDGRYEEQSYRLSGSPIHNHNIIYLIEGMIHATKNNKKDDQKMIYSAMFSLNCYKGFSVIRTLSTEESALFIVNSVKKIMTNKRLNKHPYYSSPVPLVETGPVIASSETIIETTVEKSYSSVVKKVKKDNITSDNIGEIMLCQIPGISSVTAGAIMTHFGGSFQTLMTRIKECPDCLKEVSYLNTKNQTKHLNKTITENIVKFLSK